MAGPKGSGPLTVVAMLTLVYVASKFPSIVVPVQNAWAAFIDQYGDSPDIVVWSGFIMFLISYWGIGLAFLYVDVTKSPEFIYRTKFQPKRPYASDGGKYNPSIAKTIANALFNQAFVFLPGMFLMDRVSKYMGLGVQVSRELPAFREVVVSTATVFAMVSLGFYWSHRLLHIKSLYKYHKAHHSYHAPIALSAIYAHPLEAFLSSTLSILGPAFLARAHLSLYLIGMVVGFVSTCRGHSGYGFGGQQMAHDLHHSKNTGNYGNTGLLDYIFGTTIKV